MSGATVRYFIVWHKMVQLSYDMVWQSSMSRNATANAGMVEAGVSGCSDVAAIKDAVSPKLWD